MFFDSSEIMKVEHELLAKACEHSPAAANEANISTLAYIRGVSDFVNALLDVDKQKAGVL